MSELAISRRQLLMGGSATAAIAWGGALATATPAAATDYAVHSAIPRDAFGNLVVVKGRSVGNVILGEQRISFQADGTYPIPLLKLQYDGDAGGPDGGHSTMWAISTDGYLYYLGREWKRLSDGKISYTWTSRRIGPGWLGTRDWTWGNHLYRLKEDGALTRYTRSGFQSLTGVKTVFTRGTGVRSVVLDRTITFNGAPADVLLANTTSGDLREYIVPVANPAQWRSRILRPAGTGWQQFSKITSRRIGVGNQRLIMGLNDARLVRAYVDANRTDFSGSDIRGGATSLPVLPIGYKPS